MEPGDGGIASQEAANVAALVNNTGGTVSGTLKVIRTDTLAHAVADISDNETAIVTTLNAVTAALQAADLMA